MGYNFFIDSLGFNKAASPENPYQRATAPFRKDQIDTAQQVGDQSLTGWWTRGELSFHRGAGVKYYEILDGTDITNRYTTSDGVSPRTPGEVRLGEEIQSSLVIGPANPTVVAESGIGSIHPDYSIGGDGFLYNDTTLVDNTRTYTAVTTPAVGSQTYAAFAAGNQDIIGAAIGSNALTVLYTHTRDMNGLWVAKDRLWVLDAQGASYQTYRVITAPTDPTTPGGALDDSAPVLEVGHDQSFPRACLAESPGGVYLSLANRIYYFGLDTSSTVPTVANGIVVTELAEQEPITAIHYYLGYLVVCSEANTRVALINSDGSLTLGPVLFTTSDTGRLMASHRDRVYLMGKDVQYQPAGWRLITLHLGGGDPSGHLMFPWWADSVSGISSNGSYQDRTTPGVCPRVNGITVFGADGGGNLAARYKLTDYSSSPLVVSGTLTTGFHRFGTLEPKCFQYLLVKTEGTVGSVSVSAILPDGTEANIGSLNAGSSTEFSLASAVPGPQEYLALKFTLNGDGTNGPMLLGYQIKALPVPKRQRLIRVPVFMFDVEQDSGGHRMGRAKDSWRRLQELESYEDSHSVVTYTDDDTGETGTAYIESVEAQVESTSSARASDRGFGGIVNITLRRIGA